MLNDREVPEGWRDLFLSKEKIINSILVKASNRGVYYPSRENLFRAFHLCPLDNVRVVIVGQDPYKNQSQACGLSFSVPRWQRVPPSLNNIYKCIKKCDSSFVTPNHGDLSRWCEQGVLLLNMCLTYFPNNELTPTQRKFWLPFINTVIEAICIKNPNVIFVLWGKEAENSVELPNKVTKLVGVHPSGFNGDRFVREVSHFSQINSMLDSPIDWNLD